MKLTLLLMMVGVFQVSAFTYAQRVTLKVRDQSLESVLLSIQAQSDYNFLFKAEYFERTHRVTLDVKDKDVKEVLPLVLKDQPFDYRISGNIVTLVPKVTKTTHAGTPRQQQVTGRVTDSTGAPLAGVSVFVRGTSRGTATDSDGRYQIQANPSDVLVFRLVGYGVQTITISGQPAVNITLLAESSDLDEVVVVGYGTQKKSDLTGALTSVTSENFNGGIVTNAQQLMQGKAAGVNITASSGKPGGASTIRIRGGTSISAGNDPLYVVDGVPLQLSNGNRQTNIGGSGGQLMIFNQEPPNPLNAINPADIESIEVLKDASATAIYGSRGANGVILVTTKKGKQGSIVTSYDTYVGLSNVTKTLKVLDGNQYRQFMVDHEIANYTDRGQNTDWQDLIFREAFSHNHNLSLSGGTPNTLYRASFGYISQNGVIIESGTKNYMGRVNVNHKALDGRLSFDMNISGAVIDEDNAPVSSSLEGEGGNILKDALRFNPTFPVYEEDGSFAQINQFIINPVSYAKQIEDNRVVRRNLGNLSTTYKLLDPLRINVNLGYTYEGIKGLAYVPRSNPLGQGLGGLANLQMSEHWSKLMETTLMFNKQFGMDHHLDAIAGYSYQYFVDEGSRNRVSNFISDEFKYFNIGAAGQRDQITSYKESSKLISFYGRVNYNYASRYLLTLTLRRDGSSRFGSANKWGLFPSGSAAWRVSGEDFFPSGGAINDLKLRVSYGVTGNQEIGNLIALSTLGATGNRYVIGGTPINIVSPERYANPNLKWEETSQWNMGADFQLWNNRVYGSFDWYRKITSDLLLSFNIPSPSVVSTQIANVGRVRNQGIEIALGSTVIENDRFQWKADLNVSANRNKVLTLSNDQWSVDLIRNYRISGFGLTGVNSQAIIPGEPLGTFYGPVFTGMVDGVQQFEDVDGDGSFSITNDVKIIGNTQPDYLVGFTNSFSYKDFDLSFLLRGSFGNDVLNNTALDLQRISLMPGQNVLAESLSDGLAYGEPAIYSSRWIEDGSFVRLDNLTLGYRVPQRRFSNLRLYVTGQNLFLITKYSGLDPEVVSSITGVGEAPRGIDYMSYPRARTFLIGASLSF